MLVGFLARSPSWSGTPFTSSPSTPSLSLVTPALLQCSRAVAVSSVLPVLIRLAGIPHAVPRIGGTSSPPRVFPSSSAEIRCPRPSPPCPAHALCVPPQ